MPAAAKSRETSSPIVRKEQPTSSVDKSRKCHEVAGEIAFPIQEGKQNNAVARKAQDKSSGDSPRNTVLTEHCWFPASHTIGKGEIGSPKYYDVASVYFRR